MYLKYCFLKFNKPLDSVMAGGNAFQSLIITYCDLCCPHLVLQNGSLVIDLRLVSYWWISWAALTSLNKKSTSLLRALNTQEQRWNRLLDDNGRKETALVDFVSHCFLTRDWQNRHYSYFGWFDLVLPLGGLEMLIFHRTILFTFISWHLSRVSSESKIDSFFRPWSNYTGFPPLGSITWVCEQRCDVKGIIKQKESQLL